MAVEKSGLLVHQVGSSNGGRLLEDGNWAGHVVVVSGDFLVDLTADQVPGLPPLVVEYPTGVTELCHVEVGGLLVTYKPLRCDRSYDATIDWRLEKVGPVSRLRDAMLDLTVGLPGRE